VGLSVATELKAQLSGADVTIIAENFYENTTSYGSGGFWEPYQVGNTAPELIKLWGEFSYNHFLALHSSPSAAQAGVQVVPAFFLAEQHELPIEEPCWKDIVCNFKDLTSADLRKLSLPENFVGGYSFLTVAAEQKYYLNWLTRELEKKGVIFETAKVSSLIKLANSCDYDIIVNCTGLGAADLLLAETDVYPVRGQVLRVKAPWIKAFWQFGSSYMIPNVDSVVVGGTAQVGDYNTEISDVDTKAILDGACSVFPALREAVIEKVWVGLRPCRKSGIRLECELIENTASGALSDYVSSDVETRDLVPRRVIMAHCYGHGGCGVTLGPGCAHDLVKSHITPLLSRLKAIEI
jgi:D-amino-acid oxidase